MISQQREARDPVRHEMPGPGSIPRRVLIVDDEAVNRGILGAVVSRQYDAVYAENGAEALRIIQNPLTVPNLILLDLMMPVMDGCEVLRRLQSDPQLRRIPVIVLTADSEAEIATLQLGAVDFLTKPFDLPDVIMARINRSIEMAEDKMLIREAENDALTGLYSRQFFLQYAQRYDRYFPDVPMDAVMININRFHLFNELYGREAGDVLLRAAARAVESTMEGAGKGLAGRYDSDTFCAYLPHREGYEKDLLSALGSVPEAVGGMKASFRVGIYPNADVSIDIAQRLDRANLACSRLRGTYDTACSVYDTRMREQEIFAGRLMEDVDAALAEKQFKVYYQPKYGIQHGEPALVSAEALIRWVHPEHGMVSPGVFIPVFEQNGLVSRLDHYVWEETAAQIRDWKERYGITVPVSVNVSRVDVFEPGLKDRLLEIVRRNQLDPREYLLEITESAYTEQSDQIISTVSDLRDAGFRVEMDDFGSGYSSLNMLTRLPIDALKLDMGFIRNIAVNPKDLRMVELMIDIAKFLGVPVIAEGVETAEQVELLRNAGCDIIQGYYFSRPLPPEEFDALIEKELTRRRAGKQTP